MKVTKVTPWLINAPRPYLDTAGEKLRDGEYVFVKVQTDAGLSGWGEIAVSSP